MTDLHWETITREMRQVMIHFEQSDLTAQFYLGGGTALALQLGHRRSVDLDFFTPTEDVPTIRERILAAFKVYQPIVADQSWGNLALLVNNVRVGFYGYGYDMVAPFILADGLRLASIADIGLMKLDALRSRASRKDFHDLYAIAQALPLRQLLDLAPDKYPSSRDFEAQVVRFLVFFDRAEAEEPLPLMQEVPWETVKDFFRQQAISLAKSWLK